jgi:hypothetical protein
MTPSQFVEVLASECRDAAVSECITNFDNPPGRRPDQALVELSQWFRSLQPSDRERVIRAMQHVADSTLFGVFCVLDGVRAVEPYTEKSTFAVSAQRGGVTTVISPTSDFLHDIYRSVA